MNEAASTLDTAALRARWDHWAQLDPFAEPAEWTELGVELGLEVARRDRDRICAAPEQQAFVTAFARAAGSRPHAVRQQEALQQPWLPAWPQLRSAPFPDEADFAWLADVETTFPAVQRELDALLSAGSDFQRAVFDGFGGKPWTARYFHLLGQRIDATHEACPETSALLERVPQNLMHACFSCLPPGGALPPHVGPSNTSLIAHLGLRNCEGSMLFAGSEARRYREGQCLVLDDSYVHGARNVSDRPRYTLMFSFWHPDLDAAQRRDLTALYRGIAAFTGAQS